MFIAENDNIPINSGIQLIDSSYVTLLQNKHILQSNDDIQQFSISSDKIVETDKQSKTSIDKLLHHYI